MQIDFKVIRDSRGFVVIRINGEYSQHAHCKTKNGARQLIYLINNSLLPRNKYLQGSCARLLTEDEYRRLKQKKQKYVNRR